MFLLELKHPNIIKLENIIRAENDKDIYLVFEHMDIDLYLLVRENILEEKHKKFIFFQIVKAIYYIHSGGLIHRDIKPSNILVNENCEAKLCDFGLVRSVDDETEEQEDVLTEYIATRWFRAPEILLGSRTYSKAIDIWSLGCLLGEMIKGKPLFPGNSTKNQIEKVLMWTGPPTKHDLEGLNTKFGKEMFEMLLKVKKINASEWFPNISPDCLNLISRMLEFNPEKRLKIEEVIQHPYLKDFFDQSVIEDSDKKIKIPINDNHRLSLKDYRVLLYQEIKKRAKP